MGGGGWDSDDPARGAARLVLLLLGVVVGEGAALVVVVDVVEDVPGTEAGIEAAATFAIRLMATTCERDCILCC